MKKFTLLAAGLLLSVAANAQQISFEQSESYQLGEINGQNGWTTIDPLTSSLFEISDAQASDGDQSLNLMFDEEGLIELGYIDGPERNISDWVPASPTFLKISADVYV